jgi:hypothetical protein
MRGPPLKFLPVFVVPVKTYVVHDHFLNFIYRTVKGQAKKAGQIKRITPLPGYPPAPTG